MKPLSLLLVWGGAALLVLSTFVLRWKGHDTLHQLSSADDLSYGGAAAAYPSLGWWAAFGLIAVTGLFTMFSGSRDKWIAVLGQILIAAAAVYLTLSYLGDNGDTELQRRLAVAGYVAAAVALLFGVLAMLGRGWIGAITTIIISLLAAVFSAITINAEPASNAAWLTPVGYVLIALGSVVAIAVAGRNRTLRAQSKPDFVPPHATVEGRR